MKQRVAWAVFVIAVVVGVMLWLRRGPATRGDHDAINRPASAVPGAHASEAPVPPAAGSAHTHVTRLASPAERKVIADRIAAAASTHAAPPTLPEDDHGHDLERASVKLKAALEEAIPLVAECYQTGRAKERQPAVLMTLTGDDVSTLIDANQLVDPDGKPLEAELEACLRSTLASLELPPLGNTAPVHIKYSFKFD